MSGAPAVPISASEDLPPDPSPIGRLASGAFAGATGVFLAFYATRYTREWSGEVEHVLFGLWGLYWGAGLAWGAQRIRPRESRTGLYRTLMGATVAQAFFLAMFWGAHLTPTEAAGVGRTGVVAFLAGPVLAAGLAVSSRRGLLLLAAQLLGPAALWALWRWGV